MEAVERQELACAIMQECIGGQAPYSVEVCYDDKGKCYFRGGWPKLFADYSVREG
jgi:hypothetical protein